MGFALRLLQRPRLAPAGLLLGLMVVAGCRCQDEPTTEVKKAHDAPAPASVALNAKPAEQDVLELLSGCETRHHGLLFDFGSPALDAQRSFGLGPFDDVENVERAGASFARMLDSRVSFQFWLERPAKLAVRARIHGRTAKFITAYVDDKRLGSFRPRPDETTIERVSATRGEIDAGRHTLLLRAWGGPRPRAPFAEIDWLQIERLEEPEPAEPSPTEASLLTDVVLDGRPKRSLALRADTSVRCPIQVTESRLKLALGFWGQGQGVAEVHLLRDRQPPERLTRTEVAGGGGATWEPLSLDLGDHPSGLAMLAFQASEATRGGRIAFGEPRFVAPSPSPPMPAATTALVVVFSGLSRELVPPWGSGGELVALTRLAREGVRFDHYRAPSTLPAAVIASLLTGLSAQGHAITDQAARLSSRAVLLSQMVKQVSGRTALFTGVPTTFSAFGFDRGWDRYQAISPVQDLPASEPLLEAERWLQQELEEDRPVPRLLVVHARGAHPPWDVTKEEAERLEPKDYSGVLDPRRGGISLGKIRGYRRAVDRRLHEDDWIRLQTLSELALRKQDRALARLFATLDKHSAWDSSLILVLADVPGGSAPEVPFYPSGALTEDRLLAPLLIKFPGQALSGRETNAPILIEDLTRGILQSLDLEVPERLGGWDLFASASNLERPGGRLELATLGEHYAARSGSWVLRGELGKPPRLCELSVDPACTRDVLNESPLAARALWQWTYDALFEARTGPARAERENAEIDPETAAALTVWGDLRP